MIYKHILSTYTVNRSVLFLTIQFSMLTKLNGYCNSIKHESFVYTQLDDQTILFQIIQFSISHLFALNFNVKQFYLTHR